MANSSLRVIAALGGLALVTVFVVITVEPLVNIENHLVEQTAHSSSRRRLLMGADDDDASVQGVLRGGDDDDDDYDVPIDGVQGMSIMPQNERRLGRKGKGKGGGEDGDEDSDNLSEGDGNLEEVCVKINFDGIPTGTIVSSVSSGFGIEGPTIAGTVSVYSVARGEELYVDPNRAMIFNTSDPTGQDHDLETGNALVPQRLEQMLIATEDFDSSDPDDEASGAHFEFLFGDFGPAGVVTIKDIYIMDTERGGTLRCYDAGDVGLRNDVGIFKHEFTGADGELTIVPMNVEGCQRLRLWMRGSGAMEIGEVCIKRPRGGGGDPMFKDSQGRRTQFWLPVGRFSSVLSVQGFELLMRVFGMPGSTQQWVNGVAIRKDGYILFDAVLVRNENNTVSIDARLDDGSVSVDTQKHYVSTLDALKVHVGKHDFPILPDVYGDEITIKTPGFVVRFFTMPARKFKDPLKAAAFAHFDFEFLHVASHGIDKPAEGLLADLYFQGEVAPHAPHAAFLRRPSVAEVAAIDRDFLESPDSLRLHS